MSKEIKLLGVSHLEKALMCMGTLETMLRCSRQKISVMLSATAVVTSGECLNAKRTKS